MTKQPRKPPHSAHVIVSADPNQDKTAILNWLIAYMLDDCVLSNSNHSAIDQNGYWRWRMSLKPKDTRVLFERQEDADLFAITWRSS